MKIIPLVKRTLTKYLTADQLKFVTRLWSLFLNLRPRSRTSYGHLLLSNIDKNELDKKYGQVWKDPTIPNKQLKLSRKQMLNYEADPNMTTAIRLLRKTDLNKNKSVLEVGCSTGYYSETFKKAGLNLTYEGCDYSEEFIKQARNNYPNVPFKLTDATSLDYKDNEFDIVISGSCILHIVDYPRAISETARVTKEWAMFHRTPIIHLKGTSFFKKIGYDLEMLEIIFNEEDFVDLLWKNNFYINQVATIQVHNIENVDEPVFIKSYLCKKILNNNK